MKQLLIVLSLLVAVLAGALIATCFSREPAVVLDGGDGAQRAEVDALRAEIAALARRLEALDHAPPLLTLQERSNAAALEPRTTTGGERDPHWYLEQYVLSFTQDALGSEYFRLAVDAYVVELVAPIAALVRDGARPVALRQALVDMIGKRRFDDSAEVIDALLAAARPPAPEPLALRALAALDLIGAAVALPGLEAMLPLLRETQLRERALALLDELAGDAANAALSRLYSRVPDDAFRLLLIARMNGADALAALELLRTASGGEQPVRLAAARKVADFDEPEFDAFVAQWRPVETDAEVLTALGAAQSGAGAPGWSAKQATGAPDADRTRDDPKAWAPQSPEMGLQWLQVSYETAVQAHGVRIFEVNMPGAVAEVRARSVDGPWVTLWRGTANGGDQPLLIQFPRTTFLVKTIRLVLDTDRTASWNEIDAVELLGPSGPQWATRASASSTYATSKTAGNERRMNELLMQQGFRAR